MTITDLDCNGNELEDLPDLPRNIKYLEYYDNPVNLRIEKYFDNSLDKYLDFQNSLRKKFVIKIENWYIECRNRK